MTTKEKNTDIKKARQTPEEAKRLKSQSDKRKRDEYKELKKKNNLESRRLYFFEYIIKALGYNHKTFAEKIGISQQMIHWWFISDDCMLSQVEKSLETLGIKISFSFKKKTEEIRIESEKYTITGLIPTIDKTYSKGKTQPKQLLERQINENRRLKAIAQLIKDRNTSIAAVGKEIGCGFLNMEKWLINDDIKISRIYKIADAYDTSIVWRTEIIEPQKKEEI